MPRTGSRPASLQMSTFSIVACDKAAGQVGVAVQSKYLAVGGVVPWARGGVGAVASQSLAIPSFGPLLLDALQRGERPPAALTAAMATEPRAPQLQIAVVHADGEAAVHTGAKCPEWAGSRMGPGYAVQGNTLAGEAVAESMERAFLESKRSLGERLIASLEAGQAAGGDKRGQQSAVLLVEQAGWGKSSGNGLDRLVDLRVDDHTEPIKELRRLYGLWQINEAVTRAFEQYNQQDYAAAVRLMAEADQRAPGDAGRLYNLACFESLAGMKAESVAHLKRAIEINAEFREMARNDSDFANVREVPEFAKLIAA